MALAAAPPIWITATLRTGDEATVHDLVGQDRPGGPRGSVLVLVDLARAGPAHAVAVDGGRAIRDRLVAGRPEDVWAGRCRLARSKPAR